MLVLIYRNHKVRLNHCLEMSIQGKIAQVIKKIGIKVKML